MLRDKDVSSYVDQKVGFRELFEAILVGHCNNNLENEDTARSKNWM